MFIMKKVMYIKKKTEERNLCLCKNNKTGS
jgi:hypothetical protein